MDRGLTYLLRTRQQLVRKIGRWDPLRPFSSSHLYHSFYAATVGNDSRRRQCDIVHLCIYDNLVPILKRLNPSTKLILHLHDHSQTQRDPARIRRHLSKIDLIVGASEFLTNNVRQAFPEIADRCITIHNATDVDYFAREQPTLDSDDHPLVLFIGRTSPEKGVHRLIEAFGRVVDVVPDARLALVGPRSLAGVEFVDWTGEDPLFNDVRQFWGRPASFRSYLQSLAEREAPGRVTFIDETDNTRLVDFYHRAAIFVFPSIWHEPFGVPVIEAMSAGLPVIATRGGAFPEVVKEGETGLLVDRGSVDDLARALLELLQDPARRAKMGQAGRAKAEAHFNWDRYMDDWMAAYERVLTA